MMPQVKIDAYDLIDIAHKLVKIDSLTDSMYRSLYSLYHNSVTTLSLANTALRKKLISDDEFNSLQICHSEIVNSIKKLGINLDTPSAPSRNLTLGVLRKMLNEANKEEGSLN